MPEKQTFAEWRKANKQKIYLAALGLIVGMPFVLFFALQQGLDWLAVLAFGAVVLGMLMVTASG